MNAVEEKVIHTSDSHGNRVSHPSDGVVFTRIDHDDRFEYVDLLEDPKSAEEIRKGIQGGRSQVYGLALVRHGTRPNYNYYPLPLIYTSPDIRTRAAKGRYRPTEEWVMRTRQKIQDALDAVSK